MTRIFGAYTYGEGPRTTCWWDETAAAPARPALAEDAQTEVAIIGAGFTGLSAALHLAQAGVRVAVVEAQRVGWGASGRNGGFCCLGGGMAGDAALDRRFGRAGRVDYRRAELAATHLVDQILTTHAIDADRHSRGETILAHRPRDMADLRAQAQTGAENYGVPHHLHSPGALRELGMGGPFHGGLTVEAGFALNPRKYILGLARAAQAAGAVIHEQSPVDRIEAGHSLHIGPHRLRADQVILATNGYSSEHLPPWIAGRYLPVQSNVIVTRPLTEAEQAQAGWTSGQMAYDTRNLLHYFRLMPDGRFLFGMRGGLLSGLRAQGRAARKIRADFDAMFPDWRHVETAHSWSGLACIARDMLPFVGAVPGHPGLWAGMAYHGNGVAMGTYCGAALAALVQGHRPEMPLPAAMQAPLRRFPMGRMRRVAMPFAYAGLMLADR